MIRQAFGDPLRTLVFVNRSRREGIVAGDAIASTGDICFCGVRLLIGPRKLLQPVVERGSSAVKRREAVVAPELLDEEVDRRSLGVHERRLAT